MRDAQGNPLAVYDLLGGDTLVVNEFNLYGSNRLGMLTTTDTLVCATCTTATAPSVYMSPVGMKRYELSNHLGNVMTVISDKPVPIDTTSDGLWDYFNASMVSATDYYPFGMGMPGRAFSSSNYRFGFNKKETDNMNGVASMQDYGNRYYSVLTSRFCSSDPICEQYPELSPYQFSSLNPILNIDLDGLEGYNAANSSWITSPTNETGTAIPITSDIYSQVKLWYETSGLRGVKPRSGYSYIYMPYADPEHPEVRGMNGVNGQNGFMGYWYAEKLESKVERRRKPEIVKPVSGWGGSTNSIIADYNDLTSGANSLVNKIQLLINSNQEEYRQTREDVKRINVGLATDAYTRYSERILHLLSKFYPNATVNIDKINSEIDSKNDISIYYEGESQIKVD